MYISPQNAGYGLPFWWINLSFFFFLCLNKISNFEANHPCNRTKMLIFNSYQIMIREFVTFLNILVRKWTYKHGWVSNLINRISESSPLGAM